MKTFIFLFLGCSLALSLHGQSIVGDWQLIKETNCLEKNMAAANDSAQGLVDEMKSRSGATAQVVTFKEKLSGEESTRILTRKKTTNNKSFLYKFDGESLFILDKKSQTITDNYMVDKISGDSLIISNASRPCEMKMFLRIK